MSGALKRGLAEIRRSCPGSNCPLLQTGGSVWLQYEKRGSYLRLGVPALDRPARSAPDGSVCCSMRSEGVGGSFGLEQARVYSRGNGRSQQISEIPGGKG